MTLWRKRRPIASREAGFTLLEIMVALVVLGFLMAALTAGVKFGLQAWDAQARTIATHADLDGVDRTFRLLIVNADPGVATEQPTFVGTGSTLAFNSQLPEMSTTAFSRDADVRLLVDGGHRLVLRWVPHPHAERLGAPLPATDTTLVDGVDHLEFAYWQPSPQGNGGGWVKAWNAQDLPLLVRMHVVFGKGDRRKWPDFVAAPMRSRLEE
jgi:general secretion pathway protein J